MTLLALSSQIRTETLGRNCAPGVTSLRDILSLIGSSEASANKAQIEAALADRDNVTLGPTQPPSFFDTLVDDVIKSSGVALTDATELAGGTIQSLLEGLLKDPSYITNSIVSTATATIGAFGNVADVFTPDTSALLTDNARKAGNNICGPASGVALPQLSATWTGITGIPNQFGRIRRQVTQVFSSFSIGLGMDKGFGDGLRHIAGNALKVALKNEMATIKQIIRVIRELNKEIPRLNSNDYVTDHVAIISSALSLVQAADSRLAGTIEQLRNIGGAPSGDIAAAKADVEAAAELLKSTSFKDIIDVLPTRRFLKIAGLLYELEQLIDTFNSIAEDNRARTDYFAEFESTVIAESAGVGFLYIPTLSAVRCKLLRMIDDMQLTLPQKKLVKYLLKEKQWYVELIIVREMLRSTAHLDRLFTDMKKLNFRVDVSPEVVRTSYSGTTSREEINIFLTRYLNLVKRKLNFNMPAGTVVGVGDAAIVKLCQYMDERPNFHGALFAEVFFDDLPPGFERLASGLLSNPLARAVSKLEEEAGPGIVLAQQFITLTSDKGFDAALDSLLKGDVKGFLALDSLTVTLYNQLKEYAAIATTCLEETGDVNQAIQARTAYEVAQEEVRAAELFDNIFYQSEGDYVETLLVAD